jgi:hypothetical protein
VSVIYVRFSVSTEQTEAYISTEKQEGCASELRQEDCSSDPSAQKSESQITNKEEKGKK